MPYLGGQPGCSVAGTPGCATVARLLGGNPAGSATHMTSWLLVEQPGPWSATALETTLAEVLDDARLHTLRAAGLRPLLIRRPGRHARADDAPVTVFVGSGRPGDHWLERIELSDRSGLGRLDLEAVAEGRPGHGEPVDGPLFLVCTHGAKDMCCAVLGRPVAKILADEHPDRMWEVSHVGGDRWAGNLLVVPDGFLHGQLGPDDARLVTKAALAGQVRPDHLRGRTSAVTAWEQCAEIAVRKHTGLTGIDDVTAVHVQFGDATNSRTVMVTARGRRFEVVVEHQEAVAADGNRCTGHLELAAYSAAEIRPAQPSA
ncbi:MAG TPA: sucrase ferredoxin [Amycolatopsis sp.]|nr:sucrase ferredoxin [Amycolatopsis sp.]